MSLEKKRIRVFISYAWESEAFKKTIWDLGGWIHYSGKGEIEVRSDHLCSITPDEKGWDIWMLEEIKKADIVLSVCTPKYYSSFTKSDTGEVGRGVCYEATIMTDEIKNNKGINSKFYPVLPDDGHEKNIPEILRAYSNSHKFHSNNKDILRLIKKENPSYEDSFSHTNNGVEPENMVEMEKEIVKQIETLAKPEMENPIKILIRAYSSLSEINKLKIAKNIGVTEDTLRIERANQRDLVIMKEVNDKNLLSSLWNEVNNITPFENNNNPFKII